VLAREADYFALLSLDRGATRAEVRVAWADLSRTFSDDQIEATVRAERGAELVELRAALGEARDVLGDDALRSAYLAQLEEP
jgi:curved DNA-binding protein CbpA